MRKQDSKRPAMEAPAIYRISVRGRVDVSWAPRLEGMNITESSREKAGLESVLVGRLADQAALSGVLSTLYELHFPVISVECLNAE